MCVVSPTKKTTTKSLQSRACFESLNQAIDYILNLFDTTLTEIHKVFEEFDKDHNCEIDEDELE